MLRLLAVLLFVSAASAEPSGTNTAGPTFAQPPITAGNCAKFVNARTITDAGKVCGGGVGCSNKLDFSQPCDSQYIGIVQ